MKDRVHSMLAGRYRLWYRRDLEVSNLIPLLTLPAAIDQANAVLERHDHLDTLTELEQDCLARMIRVKWIYKRLPQEPIRKPILAHVEEPGLVVDCGDTRLMALTLAADPGTVSVMVTGISFDQSADWQEITSESQLWGVLGLDPDSAHLIYTRSQHDSPWAVSWLEVGDNTTSHHLHDTSQCMTMLKDEHTKTFRFTRAWFYD